jgi:hypothetical protein
MLTISLNLLVILKLRHTRAVFGWQVIHVITDAILIDLYGFFLSQEVNLQVDYLTLGAKLTFLGVELGYSKLFTF